MLSFLDFHFGPLLRLSFDGYLKLLREFCKGGPMLWKKFAFCVFNFSGNDKLCEHDLFQILEQFKQRDPIAFY